jgi:Na+(H+)/acetate symporter ActP
LDVSRVVHLHGRSSLVLSYNGYGGSVFLMGWTGGYVILAMLIAPYLRKYWEVHRPLSS